MSLWWLLALLAREVPLHAERQAPHGAEVISACFFAYALKLDMPGSSHHTIRASDFQQKVVSFYGGGTSPAPLLEAYWLLALPTHFQEAVLKECPPMVVLSYFLAAETKFYTEPSLAQEFLATGAGIFHRLEERVAGLIRESWPIDAAFDRIQRVHATTQRLQSRPPADIELDVVLAFCREDLRWLEVAMPRWAPGRTRVFVYSKCGEAPKLRGLPDHIQVIHTPVNDAGPGGRKDECSAYLTHLAKAVETQTAGEYTLFLQADALNHVRPQFLHVVMQSLQLRTLDLPFLHLGQSRMVSSTSPCKRAIFEQVVGRKQSTIASGYCCAQFMARKDTLLAPGQLWSRALQAMDDPLPSSCEHVRRGAGMHCLVYESIWHVMFGFPEVLSPRASDTSLPSFLRIPEADGSDLPDGARSTFYLDRVGGEEDAAWLEELLAKESDISGARSMGYIGWSDQASGG